MTERLADDDQPATRGMLRELNVELTAEINAQISALEGRATSNVSSTEGRLTSLIQDTAVETRRHFNVVAEGLRDDMRLLADGIAANTVAIDRLTTHVEAINERAATTITRAADPEP